MLRLRSLTGALLAGLLLSGFRQIGVAHPRQLRCGSHVFVFGAREVKFHAAGKSRRFGSFKEQKILVLPQRCHGDEVQFLPERVELLLVGVSLHPRATIAACGRLNFVPVANAEQKFSGASVYCDAE